MAGVEKREVMNWCKDCAKSLKGKEKSFPDEASMCRHCLWEMLRRPKPEAIVMKPYWFEPKAEKVEPASNDVIYCGEDDNCIANYRHDACGCESIDEWMAYCPACGMKIGEFLNRCSARIEKIEQPNPDDDLIVQCMKEDGHEGKHRGKEVFSERVVEWDDDEKVTFVEG